jgi:hypothetical protein
MNARPVVHCWTPFRRRSDASHAEHDAHDAHVSLILEPIQSNPITNVSPCRITLLSASRQTLMGDKAAKWYLKKIDSFVHP